MNGCETCLHLSSKSCVFSLKISSLLTSGKASPITSLSFFYEI
jgi:hypothetical protein